MLRKGRPGRVRPYPRRHHHRHPGAPGNRRVDGFLNILSNPRIGLLFVVPGRHETLRINGRARLVSDGPFFDDLIVKGHRPLAAVVVDIEQIFFHCAKAFLRSETWKPESWNPDALPSHAKIVKSVQATAETLEQLEDYYGPGYARRLYYAAPAPAQLPEADLPVSTQR